jgi:hypothetical protein
LIDPRTRYRLDLGEDQDQLMKAGARYQPVLISSSPQERSELLQAIKT